jgi:hypothetical protein
MMQKKLRLFQLSNEIYLLSYSQTIEPLSLKEERNKKYDINSFYVLTTIENI